MSRKTPLERRCRTGKTDRERDEASENEKLQQSGGQHFGAH